MDEAMTVEPREPAAMDAAGRLPTTPVERLVSGTPKAPTLRLMFPLTVGIPMAVMDEKLICTKAVVPPETLVLNWLRWNPRTLVGLEIAGSL